MLNFDNSTARQRLEKDYSGVVDFGMGDFSPASYLYPKKHTDYTIGGETDYGSMKIYDSDKYTIRTPQFKSAYHMAEFVNSPLPDIPLTAELQFSGADMNNFLSVPKNDLVLENYVGQEQQAEGIRTEGDFFASQAKKEAFDNNPLTVFMNSPDVEALITYTGGGFKTVSPFVTETQRKSRHKDARGVKVPAPAKRTISALNPVVKPAFEDREDYKTAKKQLEESKNESLIGTVFQPKLTRKEKNDLKQQVLQLENQQKKVAKESSIANESFSGKRGKDVRHGRQYKKAMANIQDQRQHTVIQAHKEVMEDSKRREREEASKKKAYDSETAKVLADLQENQKRQSAVKEKKQRLQDERLAKKNNITLEEVVKQREREEKRQEEEEKRQEQENNDVLKLGGDFDWKEKRTLYEFFSNHNIHLGESLKSVKDKLKQYLIRTGLDFDGRSYRTTTSWFKRFLTAIDLAEPPDLENQITPAKNPFGRVGTKVLNEGNVKTRNMAPHKGRRVSQPIFPYSSIEPYNLTTALNTPLKSESQRSSKTRK